MPFAEPGTRPHYAPDRTTRIGHIDLTLNLEPEGLCFSGESRITLSTLPSFKGTVALDLDEVLVDAVTDGSGEALDFRQVGEELLIEVAAPKVIVVRFHGANPVHGLYFTGPTAEQPERQHMAWTQCQDEDAHFIFPCHDHPGVKHTWRTTLTGPAGYKLLSNGRLVSEGEQGGRATATYEQLEAMPAYLFTAVCARLTRVDADGAPVPVAYYVPVGEEAEVQRSMGRTPAMIRHFSELLGTPYPWPRYDQVVVHEFIFGGMENTACTTMTDLLLVDAKGELEWGPDGLVAHELAHQWFGDLVTCQDWSQGWLNESWATYMEALWTEHHEGLVEAEWARWETMDGYLSEAGGRYRRPIVSYHFREPVDVFDRHLYNKGSCVLWTLRASLGDAAFFAGVKQYLADNAHQPVHTRDFQRALERASGRNLDGFFDQFVFTAGHVQLEVGLAVEGDLLTVDVKQVQSGEDVPEIYDLDLPIELVFVDGSRHALKLPVRARQRTFAVTATSTLKTVRVDPGLNLLGTIKLKAPRGWLEALLDDASPTVAMRAAEALMVQGAPGGVAAVVTAQKAHIFHGVREHLAGLIAKRGGAEARDALISALSTESDPRVKRAIATGLGQFRDAAAADALISLLSGPLPTWQLEGQALTSLGKTRDPRALKVLRAHLDVKSWADTVGGRALLGLAHTEDKSVLDDVIARTSMRRGDRIRAAAASALAVLGERHLDLRTACVERLVEMLAEPGFRAQLSAITALGQLRDDRGAAALQRMHQSAPDGRMRRSAYEALVRLREGSEVEAGLASLRARVDELADENKALRGRLDGLETQS